MLVCLGCSYVEVLGVVPCCVLTACLGCGGSCATLSMCVGLNIYYKRRKMMVRVERWCAVVGSVANVHVPVCGSEACCQVLCC